MTRVSLLTGRECLSLPGESASSARHSIFANVIKLSVKYMLVNAKAKPEAIRHVVF
jgi:hypothetical protein